MSLNTLETAYVNGEVIDASHVNELTLALLQDFVGRDANGIPSPLQNLGTLALPWDNLYAQGIILDGQAVDTSQITSVPNRLVSGATRPLSSLGDFLRADGAALEATILGDTVDLVLSINNLATSVNSDVIVAGLSAAPSTNNTALVDMAGLLNNLYAGETDSENPEITIGTVGTEISTLVGQTVAFQTATGEIFQALVKNATTLSNCFRGFYLDSTGTPVNRAALSDTDTLTLLKIGWLFVEDNGTTVDVTYRTPFISYGAPNSPQTADYWFDISNQVWKRYSGVSFDVINRTIVGQIVSDDTNTIASRSYDFSKNFKDQNNIELEIFSSELVKATSEKAVVNVYGTELDFDLSKATWNMTTDRESGVSETPSTDYYLYLSDEGQEVISDKKPHERNDLIGFYHPFESWRCVGNVFNDSGDDFLVLTDSKYSKVIGEAIAKQVEAAGVNGGASVAVSWNVRKFNALDTKKEFIAIDSNQITLVAGRHKCAAILPLYTVRSNASRLYDVTNSIQKLTGSSGYTASGGNHDNHLIFDIVLETTTTFEIQSWPATSIAQGFGLETTSGNEETYSIAEFKHY